MLAKLTTSYLKTEWLNWMINLNNNNSGIIVLILTLSNAVSTADCIHHTLLRSCCCFCSDMCAFITETVPIVRVKPCVNDSKTRYRGRCLRSLYRQLSVVRSSRERREYNLHWAKGFVIKVWDHILYMKMYLNSLTDEPSSKMWQYFVLSE